jgi:CRP/FNR family cyclic AMP-dependent transcriptional regulator
VTPPNPPSEALSDALLREIAQTGNVKRYPAQAVLINEGDSADTLFIILSGRVKVYASNDAGKEVILNHHGPGEYVGEMQLDGGVRSASVMTLEPTTCAVVTGANFRGFIGAHPDFALHLIRNLIHRVRLLTENVKSLALEDVYGRVASLLQRLAVDEQGQRVVRERLTQQDIAEHVGASREMISRILKDLTSGGYVKNDAGRIVLLKKLPSAW